MFYYYSRMTQENEIRILSSFLYVKGLVSEDSSTPDILSKAELVRECFHKLIFDLDQASDDLSEEELQSIFFEAGKLHFTKELRWWFEVLYQTFLKQKDGPRLGQLTKLMTIYWMTDKLHSTLNDPWMISHT